jgi:preprotein translocase subunit SecG
LTVLLALICLSLIGLILIQRGKGGGLAGIFGGGGMEQAFGTRAATLAQKATAVLAVLFLLLTIGLSLAQQKRDTVAGPPAPPSEPVAPETSGASPSPAAPTPASPSPAPTEAE